MIMVMVTFARTYAKRWSRSLPESNLSIGGDLPEVLAGGRLAYLSDRRPRSGITGYLYFTARDCGLCLQSGIYS